MNTSAPVPTPQPRIPLDIQLTIVEMCPDVLTRLRLVSTHKAVRRRGARLALQLPLARVSLRTQSATRSFFAFCAAQGLPREPSSPLALLIILDITLSIVNPADMGNLVALLANVPRLRALILRDPEMALRNNHSLYVALQRLRTLEDFFVSDASTRTLKLVSEIASPLKAVIIIPHHMPAREREDDDVLFFSLTKVLARHKDTLIHLGAMCTRVLEDEVEFEGDLVVFEKVWNLAIPDCGMFGAESYIRAFPNVTHLDVGSCLTTRTKQWSVSLDELRWRNMNNFFSNWEEEEEEDGGYWHSMKLVRGGLLDLFVFWHMCTTLVLEIEGLIKDYWAWQCVPQVVHCHAPSILRLSVSPSLRVNQWEILRDKMEEVRCLVLRFVVQDAALDLEQLADTAIRAAGSFIGCHTVFLDFMGENDTVRGLLQGIDHASVFRRILDSQCKPSEIGIRTPAEITYYRYCPVELWEAVRIRAKGFSAGELPFEIEGRFPKELVSPRRWTCRCKTRGFTRNK